MPFNNNTLTKGFWIILSLGILFRTFLCLEFPVPFTQPDTPSYLILTHSLLLGDGIRLHEQRPPGYSAFMAGILAMVPDYMSIILVQHLLGIVLGIMAFFILKYYLVRQSEGNLTQRVPGKAHFKIRFSHHFWILLGFASILLNPGILLFEHTLLADFLLAFFSMAAIFILFLYKESKSLLLQLVLIGCLGLVISFAVLAKPVAWAFVVLLLFILFPIRLSWQYVGSVTLKGMVFALCFFPLIHLYSDWHEETQGKYGLSLGSGITLFGISAQWIDFDSPLHQSYKKAVQADIEYYIQTFNGSNPNWIMWSDNSPAKKIGAMIENRVEYYNVLEDISKEAILKHPMEFVLRGIPEVFINLVAPGGLPGVLYENQNHGLQYNWSHRYILEEAILNRYHTNNMVDMKAFGKTIDALEDENSLASQISNLFSWFHILLTILPFWVIPLFSIGYFLYIVPFVIVPLRQKQFWKTLDIFLLLAFAFPILYSAVIGFFNRGMGRYGLPAWHLIIIYSMFAFYWLHVRWASLRRKE